MDIPFRRRLKCYTGIATRLLPLWCALAGLGLSGAAEIKTKPYPHINLILGNASCLGSGAHFLVKYTYGVMQPHARLSCNISVQAGAASYRFYFRLEEVRLCPGHSIDVYDGKMEPGNYLGQALAFTSSSPYFTTSTDNFSLRLDKGPGDNTTTPTCEDRFFIRFNTFFQSTTGAYKPCGRQFYACDNRWCINKVLRCDGYYNCDDQSDEFPCNHQRYSVQSVTGVVAGITLLIFMISVMLVGCKYNRQNERIRRHRRATDLGTISGSIDQDPGALRGEMVEPPPYDEPPPLYEELPPSYAYANPSCEQKGETPMDDTKEATDNVETQYNQPSAPLSIVAESSTPQLDPRAQEHRQVDRHRTQSDS